jgi:ribosomal protein S18 acetylase RimI-like enzyme
VSGPVEVTLHRGPPTPGTADAAAAALADAFAEDSWVRSATGGQEPGLRAMMRVAVDAAARRGGLLVAHGEHGEARGASTWVPAGRRGGGVLDATHAGVLLRLPFELRSAGMIRLLRDQAQTGRVVDRHLRRSDAYLWVLGVRRAEHGRGIGRALVEATVADAIAAGRTRLVLATHDGANVAVYRALGFELLDDSVRSRGHVVHVLARSI